MHACMSRRADEPARRPLTRRDAGRAAAAFFGIATGAVAAGPLLPPAAVSLVAVEDAALPAPSASPSAMPSAGPIESGADGIAQVLPGAVAGDPVRGRAIVATRQVGLCLLCHAGPFPEEPFQGNLAPDLAGAGLRSTAAQLRLRIVDPRRINPDTIMPGYYVTDGLHRVAPAFKGKPILDAQQVEDVVAFLQSLTEPPAPRPPQ
jgi:sulfur-oxidizing protein SoxX